MGSSTLLDSVGSLWITYRAPWVCAGACGSCYYHQDITLRPTLKVSLAGPLWCPPVGSLKVSSVGTAWKYLKRKW
jgi:hypothetical protein